jgi:hypothetical protein
MASAETVTYRCPNKACGWEDPKPYPPRSFLTCPKCAENTPTPEDPDAVSMWMMVPREEVR